MDGKQLFSLLIAFNSIQQTVSLLCYMCTRSTGLTAEDTNTNCLINSTEVFCESTHDRCYSFIDNSGNSVHKGCTSSEQCMGNTICCTDDFCNAGYATGLKTGSDKQCQQQSDCIQQSDDMSCSQTTEDPNFLCRCTHNRYNIGAICQLKSDVSEYCDNDQQCLLYNSFCENLSCRCGDQFYPNRTSGSCLLKRPLTDMCTMDIECRADNSICNGEYCVCKLGYYSTHDQDHCSDGDKNKSIVLVYAIITIVAILTVL